ncbi:hypothetical protein H257_05266 [Aphanomyces astaci]|uniref:Uncharacterized protein n=1 Tax=Aphanomyces astaci TaxID=112090 RepID=W4GQN6_APHAT|nr:hypothetical protein H257_05266 [Aphanomyces astaci]ETV81636.1 hypothetical protein H257_05266 [Aphanomyces astaci]RHY59530.1 hypothetical protein DYB30_007761 [Aphanomyces astaci]RHZ10574.1 hypothetical protein DYB26_008607 [Aphanomyces astaci]RLO09772.1 hypothetical protein DYB28_010761 [Aphanomyces astaci]RQM19440.1 hypothetical protein B5M09_010614 [Aphanomyces astaci]|eukprot:XP_009828373.1 hypothetical protein H257_05266 [Aphanomyces astaci]
MSEVSTEAVMTGAAIDSYTEEESKDKLSSMPSRTAVQSKEPNEADQDDIGEIAITEDMTGPPLDIETIEAGFHFQDIDYFMYKVQRYAQEKGFIASKDGKFFSWRNPHPVHPENYKLLQRTTIYCSNKDPNVGTKPPPRFARACPWKIRILYDRGTLDYMVTDISLEHNHDIGDPRGAPTYPNHSPNDNDPVIDLSASPSGEKPPASAPYSLPQPPGTVLMGRFRLDATGSVASLSPTAHQRRSTNQSKRKYDNPPGIAPAPQRPYYDPNRETAKGHAIPAQTRRPPAPRPSTYVAPSSLAPHPASRNHPSPSSGPPHQHSHPQNIYPPTGVPNYGPPRRGPPGRPPYENEHQPRGYPAETAARNQQQDFSLLLAQENMTIQRREVEMKWELERQQIQDMELRREMEKQRFFVELQQHERLEKEAAANQRILDSKAKEAEMMLRVNKLKARQELVNAGVPIDEIDKVLGTDA